MKNNLILILLLSSILFISCDDDDVQVEYLTLSDISLSHTINGNEKEYTLTAKDEIVHYSAELTFADKTFGWNLPTFIQKIDTVLVVDKNKVVVKDAEGTIVESIEVSVTKGEVKVSFQKVGIDYSYIPGNTYTIGTEASLKDQISEKDFQKFLENGATSECVFYPTIPNQNVTSNLVTAFLKE